MSESREFYRRKKIDSDGYIVDELWEKEYNSRTGEVSNNRLVMDTETLEHFDDETRRKDEAMNEILDEIAKKDKEILEK